MRETKRIQRFDLMTTPVDQGGVANLSGDESSGNTYDMGIIGSTPSILTVTLTGKPGHYFKDEVNFTIPAFPATSSFAQRYSWNFLGITAVDITPLIVEIWNDADPEKSKLHARCSGGAVANLIGKLAAGPYHLDISGYLGNAAQVGQYSVALQALPIPGPTTFALLLASLGLARWSARRRKFA